MRSTREGKGTQAVSRRLLPEMLVRISCRHPRYTLVLWALLAIIATPGVVRLKIETSTDSVLDRSGPDWQFYQESQELFGGDEIVVVMVSSATPYRSEDLEAVAELTAEFEAIPGVRRVDSLASVPIVEVLPDGVLSLEPALAEGVPTSAEGTQRLATRIERDRISPRSLVSESGSAFAINLLLEQGQESRYDEILAEVDRLTQGRGTHVSGVPIFRSQASERTRAELALFVPLTVALVAILMFGLFRSLVAVIVPLLTAGVATWIMLGVMGVLAVPLTISTVILPSVLLALGCAYTMHVLTATLGLPRREDRERGAESVALPIALSGLTTAIGFVAVSFVRIEAVRDVGGFGALGVLVVLGATLTAAPAGLTLWPPRGAPRPFLAWLRGSGARLTRELVERRSGSIVGVSLLLAVVAAVGATRLNVETDVVVWFQPDDPIRIAYDRIRDRLSGISPMNLVVSAPETSVVSEPDVVSALAQLTAYLEELPEVGKALSVADPLRQLHGGFADDAAQPIPDRLDLIEQYLLLLESVEQLGDVITDDRRHANVLLRLDNNGSEHLLEVASEAETWWRQNGVGGHSLRATGIMYEFARAEDEIAMGQIRGLLFAVCAIGALLLLTFRSAKLAALALVPNAVPVLVVFGAMGAFGIALDAGTVLVGNLAFGIAVDNTVHVVSGFQAARAEGLDPSRSLGGTLSTVLAPIVSTTIAVTVGFLVLGLSGFTFTRNLGLLTSGIMVLCLAADVLLLPSLLLRQSAGTRVPGGGESGAVLGR